MPDYANLASGTPVPLCQQLRNNGVHPLVTTNPKLCEGGGMVQTAKNNASAAVVVVLHTCSPCCVLLCRCLIHGLLERDEAEDYLDEIKRKKGDLR